MPPKTYTEWTTIHIDVPAEFITHTKSGAIRIKKPLTAKHNIAKHLQNPSIIIRENNKIDTPVITKTGTKKSVADKQKEVEPIQQEYKRVTRNKERKKMIDKVVKNENDPEKKRMMIQMLTDNTDSKGLKMLKKMMKPPAKKKVKNQ